MKTIPFDELKKQLLKDSHISQTIELCCSGKKVNLRALKMKDKVSLLKTLENIDESPAIFQKEIDRLILKYAEDIYGNELEIDYLTEEERLQIMYNIRLSGKKFEKIKLSSICPECDIENEHIFEESNVILKKYKQENSIFTLSLKGYKIKLNDIKRGFEVFATEYIESNNITTEIEKQFVRIAGYIEKIYMLKDDEEVELEPTFSEKLELFNLLPESEISDINEIIKSFDYGLKYVIKKHTCSHCSKTINDYKVSLFNFFLS